MNKLKYESPTGSPTNTLQKLEDWTEKVKVKLKVYFINLKHYKFITRKRKKPFSVGTRQTHHNSI